MNKRFLNNLIFSLLSAVCVTLLVISCDNLLMPNFDEEPTSAAQEQNTPGGIPAGKGAFYLAIGKIDARAIIPGVSSISSYILEFTDEISGDALTPIEITSLSESVFLSPGTYTLKVSAFSNYGSPPSKNLAAEGEITSAFTINEGANSPVSITLNAAAISDGGTGSFKWNITVPSGITIDVSSSIKIFKYTDNTEVYDETPAINGNVISGQVDLDAGYYMFLLYLKKDNDTQPFSVFPILHIYKNMESVFNLELTANNFTAPDAAVTVTKGSDTTNHSSLTAALNSITTAGNYTVKIGENQNLAPYTLNVSGADITLTAASAAVTVQLASAGSIFTVNSGTTLRLSDGVTLQGISTNTIALVMVDGGNLYMSGTSRITGNTIDESKNEDNNGGGIQVKNNGSFNMSGGIINNNKTLRNSGGIYVDSGTFKMTGGEISGNEAGQSAGGVGADGTFVMEGGEISGNTAGTQGGGLYIWGTATLTGGEISGNTAGTQGGGLFVWNTATLKKDGVIKNNTAASAAGGVVVYGTFVMEGGEISGNTAATSGGGLYVFGEATLTGGEIKNNTSTTGAAGGVAVSNGAIFKMEGGEISGNNAVAQSGGGIYIWGEAVLTGGEIKNNTASSSFSGGGVFNGGMLTLGRTIKIFANQISSANTTPNNVRLANEKFITLGTGADAPTAGMEVWVQTATASGANAGVIVDTGASAGQEKYFKADEAGKVIAHDGVQLKIIDDPGELDFIPMNNETEYEVAMGTYKGTVINIPATYNGLPVTKIAQYGFNVDAYPAATSITKVIIPASVTIIASNAFSFCNYLTSVTFEGTIAADNFDATNSFPGDLRTKYLATGGAGGAGTYTRVAGDGVWTKMVVITGSGTAGDPYQISSEAELRQMGRGTGAYSDWTLSAYYVLTKDITITGDNDSNTTNGNWTPIGGTTDPTGFKGTFDGDGHTISGIIINSTSSYQGLFGAIGSGGLVKNLGLYDVNIVSTANTVGGITGGNYGTIENCFVTGGVVGASNVGSIAGYNENTGLIQNCFALCSYVRMTGINNGVGRVTGQPWGTLNNNYAQTGMILTKNNGLETEPATSSLTGIHGADITASNNAALQTQLNNIFGSNAPNLSNCFTYNIGDAGPAGGKIFYYNPAGFTVQGYGNPGDPGYFATYTAYYLEAAPADEVKANCGGYGTKIAEVTTFTSFSDSKASLIGNGRKDTRIIVNHLGTNESGKAAQLCASKSITVGGTEFSDWFLPSLGELNELYKIKGQAEVPTTGYYWSSSQYSDVSVWLQSFSDGGQIGNNKSESFSVRAIRAF